MDDSVAVTALNGISGNGQSYKPLKLGGTFTENTTITGNKEFNINSYIFRLTQNDPTTYHNLFELSQLKNYTQNSDFSTYSTGLSANKTSTVSNGTFNLFTLQNALRGHAVTHKLTMSNSAIILKTGDTSTIGYGDVANLDLTYDGQSSTGGHITSMRNLTLNPIYKGANSVPYTVYRYVSLAIMDLTQVNGDTASWVVPTDRYAIYQEGETDKVVFKSEIIVFPNLPIYANDAAAVSDTAFPSGGLYKTTGSVALKVKP